MFLRKKARLNRLGGFIALSFCLLSGCASRSSVIPVLAASSDDSSQPFTLSIIEEVNDGDRLHVAAQVKAKELWDISNVLLHLKAMRNGAPVGESFYPLAQSIVPTPGSTKAELKAGESRSVRISVDARDFTDYQLDLVWGKEAEQFLDSLPKSATVEVRDVTLVYPAKSSRPSISGSLYNKGRTPLLEVAIAVGFVWVPKGENLDLSVGFPDNESVVVVSDISIPPGASQPFSIEVELDMPQNSRGRWEPLVRVVEKNESNELTTEAITADGPVGDDSPPATE